MHAAKIANSPRLQKLAQALNDGNWHSTKELTTRCDNYAVGTSISELRANGMNIEARRVKSAGGEHWEYRSPLEGVAFDCLYEERVAIMHYDGGLSVADAEDAAYKTCYRKMEMNTKADGSVEFKHTLIAPGAKPPASKHVAKQEEQGQMSFEAFRQQARNRFRYE
ncbi:MAG: hypothetical protein HXX17_16545 [Geobacteraceae bacterium]|nr:hypothetical protein [Geobacteraceae bacterium]